MARHLFDQVIGPDGILASKARLLCTNAIPFIQQSDEIIMLRHGSIIERGTYSSARSTNSEIGKLLEEFGKQEQSDDSGSDSEKTAVSDGKDDSSLDELKKDPHLKRRLSHAIVRKASMVSIHAQKQETFRALKKSTRPKEVRVLISFWYRHLMLLSASRARQCQQAILYEVH